MITRRTAVLSAAGLLAAPASLAQDAGGKQTLRFREDPGIGANLQSLDLFLPKGAGPGKAPVPLVFFIHGGAWMKGDKVTANRAKSEYFTGLGYAFASTNYRLRPDATLADAALDVASAIAYLQNNASKFGLAGNRIALMGHSAGAYYAALVTLDRQYFEKAGVKAEAIRAVSLLDGAGYDVVEQASIGQNRELYLLVFGNDPAEQAKFSPLALIQQGVKPPPFLIHHVDRRQDSARQAANLAKGLAKAGGMADVRPAADKTHQSLNSDLGKPGDIPTEEVTAFLRRWL